MSHCNRAKPETFPKGLDDFRTNPEMNTYADLFGDGSIEFTMVQMTLLTSKKIKIFQMKKWG